MNLADYLSALRRRWAVIVAATFIALAVGFLTTLGGASPSSGGSVDTSFSASAIAWNAGGGQNTGLANLSTLAAITTIGEVPARVAKELGGTQTPSQLAGRIKASADSQTQLLTITASGPTPARAEELADAFAAELIDFVKREEKKLASIQEESIEETIKGLEQEIAELDAQIQTVPEREAGALISSRDTKANQLEQQELALDQVGGSLEQSVELNLLSPASATTATGPGAFQPPRSIAVRLIIMGILGLLAGIAIVLVLERFDTRIYGKPVAEEHFGLPVIAEIPSVRARRLGKAPLVAVAAPASPSGSAYRLLAAELGSRTPSGDDLDQLSSPALADKASSGLARLKLPGSDPQVLLVTSAGPGEGKTSLVANLAASLSELGKRVLVLSCDFHHPEVHRFLDVPAAPGLVEALANGSGPQVLNGHIRTADSGGRLVEVVPSGGKAEEKPARLLNSQNMTRAIEEAKGRADFVLLDTPPLLASSDAVVLFSQVDSVLVVARAGKTTTDMAMRTSELLLRLEAPASGIVLNATRGTQRPHGSRRDTY